MVRVFDPLLFLRGLAAVAVIFYHSIPAAKDFRGNEWTWWLLPSGSLWVYVFFLLSGYLIGKTFWIGKYEMNQKGLLDFYERRALRILPLYYLSVLGVGLLGWPEVFHEENRKVLFDVLLLKYSIIEPLSPFDNSFWSISTEVQFYLFAPLLCWLFLKSVRSAKAAATLFLLFAGGLWFFKSRTFHYRFDFLGYDQQVFVEEFYTPILMNLDVFLAGILLNWFVQMLSNSLEKKKDLEFSKKLRWIGSFILLNVYIASTRIEFDFLMMKKMASSLPWIVWQPMLVIFGAGAYIVIMESTLAPPLKGPGKVLRVGEHIGLYGYGIYLWHGIAIQWSEKLFGEVQGPLMRFLLIATAAVVFAYAVGSSLERLLRVVIRNRYEYK